MSRSYVSYNGGVRSTDGRCPDHRMPLADTPHTVGYYISEPQQGPDLAVNLQAGQKLFDGRYTIKAPLGKGAISTVYLADDSVRCDQVALKIVPFVSYNVADQLKRAVELNYKVSDYSNLIRLYDAHVVPHDGTILLLVSAEHADGGTFAQWLLKNKDNACKRQTEGLHYLKLAFRGVGALHAAGIVHGSIDPECLLFVGEVLKASNLSLSECMRNIQKEGCNDRLFDRQVPSSRAKYVAPEQFMAPRSGEIDARSDIYAMGVILYQLFDRQARAPFEGTCQQLRQRHLHVPVPILENAATNIARVVARCLQKDPAQRYGRIAELIDDLEGVSCMEVPRSTQVDSPQLDACPPDEQVQELWDRACQLMDEDNLNEAGRLCDRILNIFPEFDEARSMRDEIDNRYVQAKQFYETIRDGYETIRNGSAKQSCDELLSLLNETVRIYPDHPDGRLIQSQLVSLADEYKDARDRGIEAISKGKFLQAKAVFRQTHQLNPGLARVTELLDFVTRVQEHVESARAGIDAAIERQNWNKALSLARALDAYLDDIKQKGTDCIDQE